VKLSKETSFNFNQIADIVSKKNQKCHPTTVSRILKKFETTGTFCDFTGKTSEDNDGDVLKIIHEILVENDETSMNGLQRLE